MNLWGFGESFVKEADRRFARWLDENLEKNPLKCEYFLPLVVSELIGEKKAAVKVLRSTDKWYASPTARISPWWWKPSPKRRPTAFTRKTFGLNYYLKAMAGRTAPCHCVFYYFYWMPNPLKESGYSSSSCSSRLLRERLF